MFTRGNYTLSMRPRTSAGASLDSIATESSETPMKRSASQAGLRDAFDLATPSALDTLDEHGRYDPYKKNMRTGHQMASSIKSMMRRASTSMKRRPSLEQDVEELEKVNTAQSTGKTNPLKRFTSLRHRRPGTSGPSGKEARYNPQPPPIIHTPVTLQPPAEFGSGSRARASAREAQAERNRLSGQSPSRDSKFEQSQLTKDTESAVWVDSTTTFADELALTFDESTNRCDPVLCLPSELVAMVFAHLDASSLVRAERVNKSWHSLASSSPVWKEVFNTKYGVRQHTTPPPIQMGGLGVGSKVVPSNGWKKMYKARMTIDLRWKAGNASAIYFNGHTDSVYCCQFDETKIITGSRDRTIRVWDLNTYECLKVIGGPTTIPEYPDTPALPTIEHQTEFSTPNLNGTLKGRQVYHVPQSFHSASILCLQFDHELMVTGSSDHTCIVWDLATYQPRFHLKHHQAGVLDVCIDSQYIISCSKDTTICVWNRHDGSLLHVLRGHRGPVNAVQLRGSQLVSASGDGAAKLWDLTSASCIREYTAGSDRGLAAVEFSDDRRFVLAGGNNQVIYKFCALTGKLVNTFKGHTGLVRSLFLDASNSRVLSGSYDQSIHVYDYDAVPRQEGEAQGVDLIAKFENWTTSWILSAKSDYRRIVCTSQDGRAVLLDFGFNVTDVDLLSGIPNIGEITRKSIEEIRRQDQNQMLR